MGAGYPLVSGTIPTCTLRDMTTYGPPILTQCVYTAASNVYTLNMLSAVPSSRYLLEITTLQQNLLAEGVTFAATTARTSAIVKINTAANTAYATDLVFVAPAPGSLFFF